MDHYVVDMNPSKGISNGTFFFFLFFLGVIVYKCFSFVLILRFYES